MEIADTIRQAALIAVPLLLAITFHEAAHGWMADRKGDPTARLMGRVTFNPLPHIDPMGSVVVPLGLMLLGSPFVFGWAKPVPVNFNALRRPRIDMAWVAVAGPGANLILALICGVLFHLALALNPALALALRYPALAQGGLDASLWVPLLAMLKFGVQINILLMLFNLIPLPPLDGGRIMVGLLPRVQSALLARVEPYGMVILLLLVVGDPVGLMRGVLWPSLVALSQLILYL